MKRTLYALLVGIDKYPNQRHWLRGCVNDIRLIEEYLDGRSAEGYDIAVKTLINRQATREAVITGFLQHLSRAKSNDVALFYFSGHGSQTDTHPDHYLIEADKKNETLVCWDSREPGGCDLVDKELAVLLAKVAQNSPHITVVLDCCHASSGTRLYDESLLRLIHPDKRKRAPETYLYAPENLQRVLGRGYQSLETTGLPIARHFLLAACLSRQGATEYSAPRGKRYGIFTYFLHQTLVEADHALTYQEIIQRTRAIISGHVSDQSPQLECYGESQPSETFLSGVISIKNEPHFTVCYDKHIQHWVIDGGAVHGVKPPQTNGEKMVLAIFPFKTFVKEVKSLKKALAMAEVIDVLPSLSRIEISANKPMPLDKSKTYKAVVAGLPLPLARIRIEGEPVGKRLAGLAFKASLGGNSSSRYLSIDRVNPDYLLLAEKGNYVIARPVDAQPLVEEVRGYTRESASTAIAYLEHIALWQQTFDLPKNSGGFLTADSIELTIRYRNKEYTCEEIDLEYERINGEWKPPQIFIKVKNVGTCGLYCTLLGLTELFSVSPLMHNRGGIWLGQNQEVCINEGGPIFMRIPEELSHRNKTNDWLKLIACTSEFDPYRLLQAKIKAPQDRSIAFRSECRSTLERLLTRIQTREFSSSPNEYEIYDEWLTKQIAISTHRNLS